MTISKEEVIKLAENEGACVSPRDDDVTFLMEELMAFAAAIEARGRADQREACLKIAEQHRFGDYDDMLEAIRARGKGE
jgi:hypothetical protein